MSRQEREYRVEPFVNFANEFDQVLKVLLVRSPSGELHPPFCGFASHGRGQEMTSVVSQEWLPQQPQAGSAGAHVLPYAGTQGVGAVAADEPPVLVGDHRTEVDARHAMGAADGQDCVGRQWLSRNEQTDLARRIPDPRPSDPTENTGVAEQSH